MAYTPALVEPIEVKFENGDAAAPLRMVETLELMLRELRIMNLYLYELPRQLNSGTDPSAWDEPDDIRNDESLFN